MKPEVEKLLANKYPMYQRDEESPSSFSDRGFECSDGWAPLLCDSAHDISKLDLTSFRVDQIKEKIFQLIVYVEASGPDIDEAEDLADMLQIKSITTCERCCEAKGEEHQCH